MKKYLFIAALVLLASTFVARAATVLQGGGGGTGFGSTTVANSGKCLSVVNTNPLTYTFAACAGGAGSSFTTTTINGLSSTAYTFATSTDPNLGILISGSGSTLTFTPVWIGTLPNSRIASSSYWNSKLDSTGDGSSLSGIVVSVASSSDIAVSGKTGTNLTFSFLNPQGYITATSTAFIVNSASSSFARVANNGSDFTSSSTFRDNILGTGTGLQFFNGNGLFIQASTTNITEGANLYFTNTRLFAPAFVTATSTAFVANSASSTFSWRSNNLSDLNSTSTARSNLGLGDAALTASSTYAWRSNNGSDFNSSSTFRNNILGTGTGVQFFNGNGLFVQASTTNVTEGTNLYWTQARFNTALNGTTTTGLPEGNNLYWTQARFNTALGTVPVASTSLSVQTPLVLTTNKLSTSLTYASSGQSGIAIASSSGNTWTWSQPTSTASVNGYLSAGDWTTFNAKATAGAYTTTTISAGTAITVTNGGIGATTVANNGVTSNVAGTGITVNNATGTVTIANNGVTSITASSSVGITHATGTVNIGVKNTPIQWLIENATASENDGHVIMRTTSTISECAAGNKSPGDTVTWGLGYSTSRATATSSLTQMISGTTTTTIATTTAVGIPLNGTASTTPGKYNWLMFYTTAASSSQFTLTCWYSEN